MQSTADLYGAAGASSSSDSFPLATSPQLTQRYSITICYTTSLLLLVYCQMASSSVLPPAALEWTHFALLVNKKKKLRVPMNRAVHTRPEPWQAYRTGWIVLMNRFTPNNYLKQSKHSWSSSFLMAGAKTAPLSPSEINLCTAAVMVMWRECSTLCHLALLLDCFIPSVHFKLMPQTAVTVCKSFHTEAHIYSVSDDLECNYSSGDKDPKVKHFDRNTDYPVQGKSFCDVQWLNSFMCHRNPFKLRSSIFWSDIWHRGCIVIINIITKQWRRGNYIKC